MKVVNQYKCDLCGTVYTDKRKCEACEAGHHRPTKIVGRQYYPIRVNVSGFPQKITVATKYGEEAVYIFIGKKCEG